MSRLFLAGVSLFFLAGCATMQPQISQAPRYLNIAPHHAAKPKPPVTKSAPAVVPTPVATPQEESFEHKWMMRFWNAR